MSMFRPATREKLKLRMALDGPAGSGKTYTGLRAAFTLGTKIAACDSEHRSIEKYKGLCPDGIPWLFDVCSLGHFSPTAYTEVIKEAARLKYDVIVIDSLSHAWDGVGGALDQVDKKGGNSFTAWKDVTPQHRELIETILGEDIHVICTMRTKTEFVLEEQEKNGKKIQVPKRVGMAAVQRQGMEYEFDVVVDMDVDHLAKVSKTRCPEMDGLVVMKPSATFFAPLVRWLNEGDSPASVPLFVPAGPVDPEMAAIQAEVDAAATPAANTQAPPAAAVEPLPTEQAKQLSNTHRVESNGPCIQSQIDRILDLAEGLRLEPANIKAIVQRRGKQKVADLTMLEAQEIINRLQAKADEDDVPF